MMPPTQNARGQLDYYQVLQVDRRADQKVIERVYKTLMFDLKAHPDLGGDHERAQLLNVAYQTLRDPERRLAYDEELARREGRACDVPSIQTLCYVELDEPGVSYRSACPRCRAEQDVPHRVPYAEHLQCGVCYWFYRDPKRELVALRARVLRLRAASREAAERLWASAVHEQRRAEDAAARGDEIEAREALQSRRRAIQLLADEVRWVRL
jgi:hypothetical protein